MSATRKIISFKVTRTIHASPDAVFDGWLDPTCPGTPWHVADQLVLDTKAGGLYYWSFLGQAGDRKPHYGRFIVIDRPRRVQYTWMSPHTLGLESIVTVTFHEQGKGTLLTLSHENLPDDEGGRGHEKGWAQLTDQFEKQYPHQHS